VTDDECAAPSAAAHSPDAATYAAGGCCKIERPSTVKQLPPQERRRNFLQLITEIDMHSLRPLAACFLTAFMLIVVALAPPLAAAQSASRPAQEYTPSVGQEGKDVIWVPTPRELVEKMLDMAKLTARDIHYDLGSGDGRTVIAAAKRGARSIGVEYNPDMVVLSERNAANEGVSGKVKFIRGDIFETEFGDATVVTLYLLPNLNLKLRPTLLKMKPGTRVVSHAFTMDDWSPDQTESVEGRTAYLWIVPAPVEGKWKLRMQNGSDVQNYEVSLRQKFQKIEGSARAGEKLVQLMRATLNGDQIRFTIADGGSQREFTGHAAGNSLEGTVNLSSGVGRWTATRAN
jgi:SAM-dependent methyltransferase